MKPLIRFKDVAAAGALGLALATAPVALAPAFAGETAPKVATGASTRAEMLIGAPVYNIADERLGVISDLLIARDGKVTQAILSVGGFLGIGDKLVAVKYESLTQQGDRIVFNATKEQLKALPEFRHDGGGRMGAGPTTGERSRYIDRNRARVTEWQMRVEAFKRDARAGARTAGDTVEAAWAEARSQWQKLETATAEGWDEAKRRFEQAMAELEAAWAKAAKPTKG